jgi:putative hydrolase of the HAD superfamily
MMSNRVMFWDFEGTLASGSGGWWGGTLHDALRDRFPETRVTREMLSRYLETGFPWHEPDKPHPHLNDPEDWWRHMHGLLARALVNVGIAESDAAICASQVRTRYLAPSRWIVYDDAIPALNAVRDLGMRNIILSNHVPELEWLVNELGIGACVEAVTNSALVGYEKPHPKIYEIALKAAGSPHQAYMVGDNPLADVAGPEAAGIPGILISRNGGGQARRVVTTLREVPDVVRLDT